MRLTMIGLLTMACLTASAEAQETRGVLVPLYVSYAALQGLDVGTTLYALNHGAREANPVMRGLTGKPALFIGVKAGATVGTVLLVDKVIRPRSRTAAIATMIAADIVYTAVVAHNIDTLSRVR